MTPPDEIGNLQSFLKAHNLKWNVIVNDLQCLIDLEKIPAGSGKKKQC